MARKKKTTRKKTGVFGKFFSKKKKGRKPRKSTSAVSGLKITAGIIILSILAAGGAVGLIWVDAYVNPTDAQSIPDGSLKLKAPGWLNQDWLDRIAETAGGKRFPLDQESARIVAERLETLSWMHHVRVQTTPEFLIVSADYRRPVGLVQAGRNRKVYLDEDMVVLDYLPLTAVPVVEIKGLASTKVPQPGETWLAEDAKAAVELLTWLYTMDQHSLANHQIEKPLLEEIADIDVSNFSGRQNRSPENPHIVLTVKDGTVVRWGAGWGDAAVYLEADEKDKLARLYQFYIDYNNTLQGTVKNIELRWLKDSIPRPR